MTAEEARRCAWRSGPDGEAVFFTTDPSLVPDRASQPEQWLDRIRELNQGRPLSELAAAIDAADAEFGYTPPVRTPAGRRRRRARRWDWLRVRAAARRDGTPPPRWRDQWDRRKR